MHVPLNRCQALPAPEGHQLALVHTAAGQLAGAGVAGGVDGQGLVIGQAHGLLGVGEVPAIGGVLVGPDPMGRDRRHVRRDRVNGPAGQRH